MPNARDEQVVSIVLSRNQVDQIVRAVLGEGSRSSPHAVLNVHDGHLTQALSQRYRDLQGNRRLSRSLLAGLMVLSCFSLGDADLGIKEISERLGLNSSTVHRYVATLLAAGLLERDPDTRRYRLASA